MLFDQSASSKQNSYGCVTSLGLYTLVMYFSLKRVLNCHIIRLVKVGEGSKNTGFDYYC